MKSFQAVILAAILAAATAANEPVASPTFFKQELAEYEHQLRNLQASFSVDNGDKGTPATSPPQDTPSRPTPGGVSSLLLYLSFVTSAAAAVASHHSPTVHRCCAQVVWPRRRFV